MTPRFELFVVADLLYFERRVMRHFIFQDSKVVNCWSIDDIVKYIEQTADIVKVVKPVYNFKAEE